MTERVPVPVEPYPVGGSGDDDGSDLLRSRREPQPDSTWVVLGTLVIGLPLFVALVILAGREWNPVLDLAMTELRVRDVGTRRTPLIGLPGRIGEFPDQGSHPGPLSFYLWAGPYRLLGSSAWALQVATVVVNLAAVVLALVVGARRGGRTGVAIVAGVLALVVRGFGVELFVQPWNPYAPLLWWVVLLLATFAVLGGDHRMLLVVVIAATFCAQTHVPYLALAATMGALAVGAVIVNLRRVDAIARGPLIGTLGGSALVAVLLWLPPLIDQFRRTPGNLGMLVDHFGSPDEPAIGFVEGVRLALRHLDPIDGVARMVTDPGSFVLASFEPDGRIWSGAVLVAVWLAAVAVSAWRRHLPLLRLHAVVGAALVVGTISMSRIFGKIWYYLTLWAWVTTTLVLVAVAWTLFVVVRDRLERGAGRVLRLGAEAVAVVAVVAAVVASTVEASDIEPPEAHLSETLGAIVPATVRSLEAGLAPAVGPDGRYVVTWSDAYYFGSQGYGLVNELERRNLDVGVLEPWRVPVTPYRVIDPATADAGVHLATGIHVARWRARTDAVEVAFVEPRTAVEQREYATLRTQAIDGLRAAGLTELVPLVDSNLFLVSNDPQVPDEAAAAMARMLVLGQETAVFLVPPGSAP